MLYLFDLDGTLITSYMDRPDKDYHAWEMLPGRIAAIERLQHLGNEIGIVTNQAGVAFGHTTEADFVRKAGRVALALGYACVDIHAGGAYGLRAIGAGAPRLSAYVCYADARARDPRYQAGAHRRKPSGAMIREALAEAGASADEAIYIGDMESDLQAAKDAGVRFQWAHIFFKD
jgi:D-glycero-D-manno-heptose 1,7-bisphosphate phosphatase